MNDVEALRELERLATLDKLKSVDVYLAWAAEVEGLLPYSSSQFQYALREQLDIFNKDYETRKQREAAAQRIDEIVDEAIGFLKDKIEKRPQPSKTTSTQSPKPEALKVSLKQQFENHPAIWGSTLVIAGFAAGFAARGYLLPVSEGQLRCTVEGLPTLEESHSRQVSVLRAHLVVAEAKANDPNLITSYRGEYRDSADRLRKDIEIANANYQAALERLAKRCK